MATLYGGQGAPSNGTSGTFAGTAYEGDFYFDVQNSKLYLNTGTQPSPTWLQVPLANASGNIAVAGTLAVTGATTLSALLTASLKIAATPQAQQDIATGGTVTVSNTVVNLTATAAAATGVGLAAGTVDGQLLLLYNKHATNTIAFTTNAALAFTLAAKGSKVMVWDATAALWF
jgi:hypothetical protein